MRRVHQATNLYSPGRMVTLVVQVIHFTVQEFNGECNACVLSRLSYAREGILEGYYNLRAWRGLYYGLDAQWIHHPGYNRDRGPVLVPGFRFHADV